MSLIRCRSWLVFAPAVLLALAACARLGRAPGASQPSVQADPSLARGVEYKSTSGAILRHLQTLASDQFGGRAPGTEGETLSVDYIASQFRSMGLRSGAADGSFAQAVPVVGITSRPRLELELAGQPAVKRRLAFPDDYVALSRRSAAKVELARTEMLFVGYGIKAPEYGWDDFKGADVRGKTLVMLVGDPPIPDPADPGRLDPKMFGGEAMTYYGRWTYKYEQASQLGAAAVLIVHETGPAGYPYGVVRAWSREHFEISRDDGNRGHVAVEGWLSSESARSLLTACGRDLDALKRSALSRDFAPVALSAAATFSVENSLRSFASHNVIGVLDGADPELKKEAVVYSAHWDHLGTEIADETGKADTSDHIFNGAIDNASGVAELLEIARTWASMSPRPRRSMLFLAPTCEEYGLLGARYYAEHPTVPLGRTLADINLDMMNVWGRARGIANVAQGTSTLDELFGAAATEMGRVVKGDPDPPKGYFYRADSFEFAKAGVPVLLFMRPGFDFIGRPPAFEREKAADFVAHDYHKPSDDVKADWDLGGAVEDVALMVRVGQRLDGLAQLPSWKAGAGFSR